MKQRHFLLTFVFTCISLSLFSISGLCYGIKYKTVGTYIDKSGSQHAWNINDAHTLVWDGEAYIPVGGVFVAKSLVPQATDADFKADCTAIDSLKANGITDLILKAPVPITSSDPAMLQKIVDYLGTYGFTYGIEIDDGPKDALQGYLISPNRYRVEGPSSVTTISCNWPNVDSALFAVVNKFDNTVKTTGGAFLKDGKLTINLPDALGSSDILIVYPHMTYKTIAEGGTGDLWNGFDEYRDRLLAYFKNIKFGSGLRFFIEPFTSKMDLSGEMTGFLPDSSGFRLGFEAYLTKKHTHEGAVNAAWGLNENLDSIETAARLIPLWGNGRGIAYAYDKASGHMYPIDVTATQTWRDIVEYRDSSVQQFMNTISDTIKSKIANVPVIFKNTNYHRIFANPFGMGGYDGLGVEAYGTGEEPVDNVAGPAYSLAEESGKTMWFMVAATQANKEKCDQCSYPNENTMDTALDYFREVGCKGFFVNNLKDNPTQSTWMGDFKKHIKPSSLADFKPTVINYPLSPITGAYVKRLMPDTWWLPTLQLGKTTFIGDGLESYTILGEDKTYMWSSAGKNNISFRIPQTGIPTISFPSSTDIAKKKGNLFSITLSDTPTVMKGVDFSLLFPYETADREISILSSLIPEADKQGVSVKNAQNGLNGAKNVLKNGEPLIAYGMAQTSVQELQQAIGSDVWLEGEDSPSNNFDGINPLPGASNAQALVLDNQNDPPLTQYSASYTFNGQSNTSYELWIAGSAPADSSPVSYIVDDVNWTPLAALDGKTTQYANGLVWYKIGTVNLYPGKHTIKFRVDGRNTKDKKYFFVIDAIVFSPHGFAPNGVIKPF